MLDAQAEKVEGNGFKPLDQDGPGHAQSEEINDQFTSKMTNSRDVIDDFSVEKSKMPHLLASAIEETTSTYSGNESKKQKRSRLQDFMAKDESPTASEPELICKKNKTSTKGKSKKRFSAMRKALCCIKAQDEEYVNESTQSTDSHITNNSIGFFRRLRGRLSRVFRRSNVAN